MADEEKTEEPTAKKIENARKEGNVPKSQEMSGFFSLVVAFIVLYFSFGYIVNGVRGLYQYYMSLIGTELNPLLLANLLVITVKEFGLIILPIAAALIVAGIIGNVSQFGFLFSPKAVQMKLEKIDPIKGLKNLFSLKRLTDGMIVTLKVLVSFGVGFYVFFGFIGELPTVTLFSLWDQMQWFAEKVLILVGILMLVFLSLALADLVLKRYQYFKGLKMSKKEIKDEHKQMEGNPEVKSRMRRIMMQNAMKRMMQSVPSADVVVTNPTHYAVALRYDQQKEHAPRVVAKGVDHQALRIKEIAREHDIQIVENPSLARELYKLADVDQIIPEALYQAVAELLSYVYQTAKAKNF